MRLLRFSQQSQQTAVIFLHSINKLVLLTETQCVYFEAGTGYLNNLINQVN